MKSIKSIAASFILLFCLLNNSYSQWVQVSNGLGGNVCSLNYSGNYIFVGASTYEAGGSRGVYLSINNGSSWIQAGLNNYNVNSLAVNGNYIFAGISFDNGVYLSSNNGTNW